MIFRKGFISQHHTPPFRRLYARMWFAFALLSAVCGAASARLIYYEEGGAYNSGSGGVTAGDPIDVASGAVQISETIGTLPGRLPFALTWSFVGRDGSRGPLGMGTSLSCDYFVKTSALFSNGNVTLFTPGNRQFIFRPIAANRYADRTDPEMLGAQLMVEQTDPRLESSSTPVYRLRWKNGMVFRFDNDGMLYRIVDPFGAYVSFERNAEGFVTRISEPGGRQITLEYDPARGKQLSAVNLPLNRRWTIVYKLYPLANLYLLDKITDPKAGVTIYTWQTYGRQSELRYAGGPDPDPVTPPLPSPPPPGVFDPGPAPSPFPPPAPPAPPAWPWPNPWTWPFPWPYQWWPPPYILKWIEPIWPYQWLLPPDPDLPLETAMPPTDPVEPCHIFEEGVTGTVGYVSPYQENPTSCDPAGQTGNSGGNGGGGSGSGGGNGASSVTQLPLLISITDRANRLRFYNRYDAKGRVINQRTPDTGDTTFDYGTSNYGPTTVRYPNGDTVIYRFQWNYMAFGYAIASVTDALGHTTTYSRSGKTYLVKSVTDWRSRTVSFSWDEAAGNLLSVTTPSASGGSLTASATYDTTWNAPNSLTNTNGNTVTMTIDPQWGVVTAATDLYGGTTRLWYNGNGDLIKVKDDQGNVSALEYSGRGECTAAIDPEGRRIEYSYDDASRLKSAIGPKDNTGQFGPGALYFYNEMDQIIYVADALYHSDVLYPGPENRHFGARFDYDVEGNLVRVALPGGQKWEWAYDVMDRVKLARDPYGKTSKISYSPGGRVKSATNRAGIRTDFAYTAGGLPSSATLYKANGVVESYLYYYYDSYSRLQRIEDRPAPGYLGMNSSSNTTFSWTYNTLDQTLSETGPQGTIAYQRDSVGRIRSVALNGQTVANLNYNAAGDVTDVIQPVAAGMSSYSTGVAFDTLGRVTQRSWGHSLSGVPAAGPDQTATYQYYPSGLLQSSVTRDAGSNALDSRSYQYDPAGRIEYENANGTTRHYGYDLYGRLRLADYGNGQVYAFDHDVLGNLRGQVTPNYRIQYLYDANGRVSKQVYAATNGPTIISESNLQYDINGNLTAVGSDTYAWDIRGQLRSISGVGLSASFTYDAFGRRQSRTINNSSGSPFTNFWDGWSPADPFREVGMYPGDLTDARGSRTQTSATPAATFDFQPYGQVTATPTATDKTRARWAGMEVDGATGLDYARHRYYSPELGRFISEDPIGLMGGWNPYAYCAGDPINLTDPLGLDPYLNFSGFSFSQYGRDVMAFGWGEVKGLAVGAAMGAAFCLAPQVMIPLTVGMMAYSVYRCGFSNTIYSMADAMNPFTSGDMDEAGQRMGNLLSNFLPSMCFIADTPIVLSDGSTAKIQDLRAGMTVAARDTDTGETAKKKVTQTFHRTAHDLTTITLADAQTGEALDTLTGTPEHPLFVIGKGWTQLSEIGVGNAIIARAGPPAVAKSVTTKHYGQGIEVYNVEVEDDHTYFVGNANGGVWAHNGCGTQSLLRALSKSEQSAFGALAEAAFRQWLTKLGVELVPKLNAHEGGIDAVRTGGANLGWDWAELKPNTRTGRRDGGVELRDRYREGFTGEGAVYVYDAEGGGAFVFKRHFPRKTRP